MTDISLIAAVADNRVIGNGQALPWHLPDDLKYFRDMTIGKPVIRGRLTFDSVGSPLPGRQNIVVSRIPTKKRENNNLQESIEFCKMPFFLFSSLNYSQNEKDFLRKLMMAYCTNNTKQEVFEILQKTTPDQLSGPYEEYFN